MDEDDRNVILPLRVTRRYSLCRGGVAPLLALEDGALANFTDSRFTSYSYPCICICENLYRVVGVVECRMFSRLHTEHDLWKLKTYTDQHHDHHDFDATCQ